MAESQGPSKHGPDCTCDKCVGFQPGNAVARKHGAYAVLDLEPRAGEIAARLWELLPDSIRVPAYGPGLETISMIGAQFEKAMAALLTADDASELRRLEQDARGWARLWLSGLAMFGLTPRAGAELGLDLARTRGEAAAAYLAEKRAREQAEKDGADS